MYDVGANIGYITVELAHHFSGRVQVFAFEPQAQLAQAIAISARLNGLQTVDVFDVILGEREGSAALFLTSTSAHASIIGRKSDAKMVKRAMMTMDALVEQKVLRPPTLIKLDVEGAELSVLRGARQTLRQHQPYLLFEADVNMSRFGYAKADLFALIRETHEYSFYDVECDANGHFSRVRPADSASASSCEDVLAVPKGRKVLGV